MVAYKYGRGYRSPYEDLCHWWEHFVWRIAILLPVYQNCTNGHWGQGHFRAAAAGYGIFFFVFQVLQCDVWQFATDGGHFAEAGMSPIGFGPGNEFLAHTVDEHIEIGALEEAMRVNAALATELSVSAA